MNKAVMTIAVAAVSMGALTSRFAASTAEASAGASAQLSHRRRVEALDRLQ